MQGNHMQRSTRTKYLLFLGAWKKTLILPTSAVPSSAMHSMAVQLVHTGVELYDFYHLRNEKKNLKFVLKKLIESTTTNQRFYL